MKSTTESTTSPKSPDTRKETKPPDYKCEPETGFEAMKRVFKSMPDRASHLSFFHNEMRDWASVKEFWSALIIRNNESPLNESVKVTATSSQKTLDEALPQWVKGNDQYGVTDISAIHACGKEEFLGYHSRGDKQKGNKRKTFGLRIGYDGSRYQGYQSQGANNAEILTVEEDVKKALSGMSSMSAGRTDKDVSAVSQVISCHTFDRSVTPETLRRSFSESAAAREGRLTLFDCAVVPKKFHALFSATWRRYLYLFPVNIRRKPSAEVDQETSQNELESANNCLDSSPPVRWFALRHSDVVANNCTEHKSSDKEFDVQIDVDMEHVRALLSSLEGKELSYNGFAYKDLQKTNRGSLANRGGGVRGKEETKTQLMDPAAGDAAKATVEDSAGDRNQLRQTPMDASLDKCILHKASAYMVDIKPYLCGANKSESAEGEKESAEERWVMCVELVGSRFLRRMVRILVATAIRECQLPSEERDLHVLLKICELGLRDRSSMAITGEGLAMAGVGYDLASLSIPKFGTTTTNPKKLKKKAMKRALAEKEQREWEEKKAKMESCADLAEPTDVVS